MNVMLKVFWHELLPVLQQRDNNEALTLHVPLGAMIPFHLAGDSGNVIAVNGKTGPVVTLDYQDVLAESALDAQLRHTDVLLQLGSKVETVDLQQSLASYASISSMQVADATVLAAAQADSEQRLNLLRHDMEETLTGKADLVNGVLPTSQLPALAISQFLGEVSSVVDMLLLQGQSGDWCIRSDEGMTYIITALNNTGLLTDWTALPQATGGVSSVNGQSGAVVLGYADVGAEQAGTVAALQSSMQGQMNNKADTAATLQALNLKADKSIRIQAGTGLTGGGELAADCTLALADSGVSAGNYTKVAVNCKGVVTAGSSLAASDIPALDWSKIGSGKPTTITGYGITDAVNSSDVVSTAIAGKLLKLDTNGKFPADITGNAASAAQLATARTITLSGALTGSSSFDGSTNISISTTLADIGVSAGTFSKLTVNSKGLVTAGSSLAASDIPVLDWSKISSGKPTTLSGYGITDAVNSSDVVSTATAGKLLKLDGNAKLPADITGSAAQLAIARTIALNGALTGSSSFDGSTNISISTTLADNGVSAGTYSKLTVNSKGLVTAGSSLASSDIPALDWSKISSGKPTTLNGYGITDAQASSTALSKLAAAGLLTTDQMLYCYNTSGDLAATGCTLLSRNLLSNTTTTSWRTGLGLGTAAVANIGTGTGMVLGVNNAWGLGGQSADFMATAGSGGFNTAEGRNQFIRYSAATENNPSGVIGNSGVGLHLSRASDGSNDVQLAADTTGKLAVRAKTSGTWTGWNTVYSAQNPMAYNTTTANAANVVVNSSGELQRSTSSLRYKTDVEPMWESVAQALVEQAEPIFYRSLCNADNPQHSWYGLSAEQMAQIDPRFVLWKTHDYVQTGAGQQQQPVYTELATPEIEGVFYERLVVPLLLVVKQLKQRVAALEQQANKL